MTTRTKRTKETTRGTPAASTLRDRAIARGTEFATSRPNWFTRLAQRSPTAAKELLELVREWDNHGEIRSLYPTVSALHRFVADELNLTLERNAFGCWVRKVVTE